PRVQWYEFVGRLKELPRCDLGQLVSHEKKNEKKQQRTWTHLRGLAKTKGNVDVCIISHALLNEVAAVAGAQEPGRSSTILHSRAMGGLCRGKWLGMSLHSP